MANKLQGEKSPYLLQHQNNPVNWYPSTAVLIPLFQKQTKKINLFF